MTGLAVSSWYELMKSTSEVVHWSIRSTSLPSPATRSPCSCSISVLCALAICRVLRCALRVLAHLILVVVHELQVLHAQLGGDDLDVRHRIDAILDVNHVRIVEAAASREGSVNSLDVGEERALPRPAPAGALDETSDVDDLEEGLDHRLGLVVVDEPVEALVERARGWSWGRSCRGKFSAGMQQLERALYSVDLPTLGIPTRPTYVASVEEVGRGEEEGVSAGRGRRRAGGGGVRTRVSRIGGSGRGVLPAPRISTAGGKRGGGKATRRAERSRSVGMSPRTPRASVNARARELRFKLRTFRFRAEAAEGAGPKLLLLDHLLRRHGLF